MCISEQLTAIFTLCRLSPRQGQPARSQAAVLDHCPRRRQAVQPRTSLEQEDPQA